MNNARPPAAPTTFDVFTAADPTFPDFATLSAKFITFAPLAVVLAAFAVAPTNPLATPYSIINAGIAAKPSTIRPPIEDPRIVASIPSVKYSLTVASSAAESSSPSLIFCIISLILPF